MTRLRATILLASFGFLGILGCDSKTVVAEKSRATSAPTSEALIEKPVKGEKTSPVVAQNPGTWVTIKGQVKLAASQKAPESKELTVTADKDHCLSKGKIVDNAVEVSKDRGLKNVYVYLRPDGTEKAAKLQAKDIKPELQKPAAKTHDVDQPCCMFEPRILAVREGDFINFKNSSPVAHNTNLESDDPGPKFNKVVPSKGEYKDAKPYVAQRSMIQFSCSIHPWMNGKVMVFDHPYFALTDADGKFEIKDCPAGKYRLIYRHENGFHKGREGALGWPVEIKAGADGTMTLEPLEFEFPPESK